MNNMIPNIFVYVPGFTYTSMGPGHIDKIKLEVRDAHNPTKKFDVYTQHTIGSDGITITNVKQDYILREDDTTRISKLQTHPVGSGQYRGDYDPTDINAARAMYGYFYDYVGTMSDDDGGITHLLSYHPDPSQCDGDESFNISARDGLFLVDLQTETNTTLELLFTFYTLGHNYYQIPAKELHDTIYDYPSTPLNDDCAYIEVGTMQKMFRPYEEEGVPDPEAEEDTKLSMYYDNTLSDKDTKCLYLPTEGQFVPVFENQNGIYEQCEKGATAGLYDDYNTVTPQKKWDNVWREPLSFEVKKIKRAADEVVAKGVTVSISNPGIVAPTDAHLHAVTRTSNEHYPLELTVSGYNIDQMPVLWSDSPYYQVQNVSHDATYNGAISSEIPAMSFALIEQSRNLLDAYINVTKLEGFSNSLQVMGRLTRTVYDTFKKYYNEFTHYAYQNNFNSIGYVNDTSMDHKIRYAYRQPVWDTYYDTQHYVELYTGKVNADIFQEHSECILDIDGYEVAQQSGTMVNWDRNGTGYQFLPKITTASTTKLPTSSTSFSQQNFDWKQAAGNSVVEIQSAWIIHPVFAEDVEDIPNIFGKDPLTIQEGKISVPVQLVSVTQPYMIFSAYQGAVYSDPHGGADYLSSANGWTEDVGKQDNVKGMCDSGKDSVLTSKDSYDPEYDYRIFGYFTNRLIVNLSKSKYAFANKGDYDIIPAYFYGRPPEDDPQNYSQLKNYNKNTVNVLGDPVPGATIAFSSGASPSTKSTFGDCASQYILDAYEASGKMYIDNQVKYRLTISSTLKEGIYVCKFHTSRLNSVRPSVWIKGGKTDTIFNDLQRDFFVFAVPKGVTASAYDITFFSTDLNGLTMSTVEVFKVDMTNTKNLNQIMLKWWYDYYFCGYALNGRTTPLFYFPDTPATNTDSQYIKILCDNIIFPSAVCAYDDFTIFETSKNMERKYYYAYFPSDIIYEIVGWYPSSDTNIVNVTNHPSNIETSDIICYNKPCKQYAQ